MNALPDKIYEFADFCLDVAERSLKRDGESVPLTPKVFDLLVVLIENRGHLMEKGELIEILWKESFVEEANLNVNVSTLRRALGERPNEDLFIETIPRRGYRWVADVSEAARSQSIVETDALLKSPSAVRRFAPYLVAAAIVAAALIVIVGWRNSIAGSTEISGVSNLAILPFKPLVPGQGDGALEMGMADALITKLGRLQQITVRPTGAVSKYADAETDVVAAGRELQVDAVLDGKVQRADNRIRVTVQMLRVSDGKIMWAESFDDYFTNIFAVQDSISEKLASSLSLRLSGKDRQKMTKRQTENTEAYSLLLQARFYHEKITLDGTRKALELYAAALDKDPEYALAYASRVGAFAHLANLNIDREKNIQAARDSAERAVQLDPDLAEAHDALATIKDAFDWNWVEAETEYKKALALDPNSSDAHFSYSIFLSRFKRHDEAIREISAARRINPTAVYIQNQFTQTFIRARKYDDALAEARKAIEMEAENRTAHAHLIRIYVYKGMPDEAELELKKFPGFSDGMRALLTAEINLLTEKKAEAVAEFRRLASTFGPDDNYSVFAAYYVKAGDLDRAFEFLEQAINRRETFVITLNVEPEWDPLRSDARYSNLIGRLGLPE